MIRSRRGFLAAGAAWLASGCFGRNIDTSRSGSMRVAAIFDIHGNLPALEAVLDDIRRAAVDEIVCRR